MAEVPKTWILTGSPPEHWTLAFQGQLRAVSAADADLLLGRLRAAAGAPA